MKTLFILNKPQQFAQCCENMSEDDALLLIEDAVNLTTKDTNAIKRCFYLEEDCIARAIPQESKHCVDYPKFVELCLEYDKTVSWL